INHSEANQ
ncbi:unnamed protein product, partial [Rotaria sordida]